PVCGQGASGSWAGLFAKTRPSITHLSSCARRKDSVCWTDSAPDRKWSRCSDGTLCGVSAVARGQLYMCGIAGFLTRTAGSPDAAARVTAMTRTLSHRGPDSEGVWMDLPAGIALGHRRLAVVDLSPAGHQ